jgi:hypothetical protein
MIFLGDVKRMRLSFEPPERVRANASLAPIVVENHPDICSLSYLRCRNDTSKLQSF